MYMLEVCVGLRVPRPEGVYVRGSCVGLRVPRPEGVYVRVFVCWTACSPP